MNSTVRRQLSPRPCDEKSSWTRAAEGNHRRATVTVAVSAALLAGSVHAAGQVSSIETSSSPATAFAYTVDGIEYQWGMGSNQIMEGFSADGREFSYALAADRVEVQRRDIPGVATGNPCGIFVERLSDGDALIRYAADYPSDGSGTGNCDIAAMLASRVLNRGAVDLFSNTLPDAKNIERLDYVFDYGVLAPFSTDAMGLAGHVASEKSSNNPVKMAAILELDVLGNPAAYGPLQLVGASGCIDPALCYGSTDLQHVYSFLQNEYNEPQGFPTETERSIETVGMAFVSAARLGLQPGQRYYGFSFFADDVSADEHDLLDPSTFPDDTSDDYIVTGDDADIYGGLSGYFVAHELNVTNGAVFNDVDGDGLPGESEAGISDIGITVYVDADGNGLLDSGVDQQLGDSIDSDMSGHFVLPGLPDGNYLVVLDESDSELPPGLVSAPGTNPHPLTINGTDPEAVYFPFVNPDGTGGTTDSGTDAGGTDGTTDSGTDAGGTDGTTDSGTDAGGTDGTTDSGTDAGGTDGTTDSGTDAGGTDGATDSGTDAGGTDGTTDSGTDAGGTDGATDSGTDAGGTDGATDSGSDDGGDPQIDDPATRAVNDSYEINQGRSGIFDVLANDNDGAGAGLTLISVSDSSNATITIVDNQVEYRPNYGFYGTDTFLYVMQDGDGTQATGNVDVNVIRYSDLNNNMVNDFVECNCDDLTLQTGIHGSGIGSVSLLTGWLLLSGVALRRRQRRWTSLVGAGSGEQA